MMHLLRPTRLLFLLTAMCVSACAREDDPDTNALYFGLNGRAWEVRLHTRGGTDLSAGWNGYTFEFLSPAGLLYIECGNDPDIVLGEYRALKGNEQTLLEIELLSAASECDSLAGRWQSLSISKRKADFARRVARTGELERLQFRK
jgi:hypothetical protein